MCCQVAPGLTGWGRREAGKRDIGADLRAILGPFAICFARGATMWLYRLNKIKSDRTLRKRLREDPAALKCLRQIKTRWKNQPKFTEKIAENRERARL